MSWEDRIKEAAYTSPSGARIKLNYEDVGFEYDKRGAAYNFANSNSTHIQQLGNSGRRYPLRVFFWGSNYDTESDNFQNALSENGIGTLEHPIYGVISVVPFGQISQRDDLKTAANQAVIEVVFWRTDGVLYPDSETDPASAVASAVSSFNDAMSTQYGDTVGPVSAVASATLENDNLKLLNNARSGLKSLYSSEVEINQRFIAVSDSITRGINEIARDPETLAQQTLLMIQIASTPPQPISEKLKNFIALIDLIVDSVDAVLFPTNDGKNENTFRTNDMYLSGYVSCMALSAINSDFETRISALSAAEQILDYFDVVNEWRDSNLVSMGLIDTGSAYRSLLNVVSSVAGYLISISFSLKREYSIIIDRSRTIIDLSAELFGEVDGKLDEIINTNGLTGSEILELPAGKEIVYYL